MAGYVRYSVRTTHEAQMIPKPISPTELRQRLYSVVREVARGKNQYLVTPADEESVVMLSRETYNAIIEERELLRDLVHGEADIREGRTKSSAEVLASLQRRTRKSSSSRSARR